MQTTPFDVKYFITSNLKQETAKGGMTGLQSGNIMLRRLNLKQAKVNISVCSLKREVKVKVNKFCVGREELLNAYKPTK